MQLSLLKEFIWGFCTFEGPLIVFTVTNFNPFLYTFVSGFLNSGIIIIDGSVIVTFGLWYGVDLIPLDTIILKWPSVLIWFSLTVLWSKAVICLRFNGILISVNFASLYNRSKCSLRKINLLLWYLKLSQIPWPRSALESKTDIFALSLW